MRGPALARQRGAALLAAMLTVTLVTTLAAAALWQQWRSAEVEAAERGREQAAWALIGALDWSRLILREDARAGGPDDLTEPWAVPLEEARLSSFVADDKNVADDAPDGLPDAVLSGRIVDAQSKLNVMNLVANGRPVAAAVAAFDKLFNLLGLPTQQIATLTANLQRAEAVGVAADTDTGAGRTIPLLPQQTAQLVWLGLPPSTVAAISPYVTVLPVATPLNLNTASAEAIFASVPALDLAGATRLVAQRTRRPFKSVGDAAAQVPRGSAGFDDIQLGVNTRFFEVHGRLRLDRLWVEEHSLLQRQGLDVRIVWRERGAGTTASTLKP